MIVRPRARALAPLVTVVAAALCALAQPAGAQSPRPAAGPAPATTTQAAELLQLAGAGARDDLLTLYREALANDSTFASARFQQQALQERAPQARAGLLPQVSANAAVSGNLYDSSNPPIDNTYNGAGAGIALTLPVYRPQNWEAYEQAKLVVVQSEAQLQQARTDLLIRLATTYFNVLAARDQIIALDASKRATAEQLAQARREFEVGTKTIIDTNEAQARYDQIVAQEQVAIGTLIVRRSELQTIVGRNTDALASLKDPAVLAVPQPTDINVWTRAAEDSNFNVQVFRTGYEIATREIQRQRDAYKPTVDAVAGYNYNRFNGTQVSNLSGNLRTGNVGLQLNVPIFTGGLIQARVREALALQDKSAADLETAKRQAAAGARSAFTGVNYGLSQVQALESAECSALTQLESTQLGYQVGVRILLDVLNATTLLYQTQRDLKRARYDFLVAALQLKAVTGTLGEDDVLGVNALLQPGATTSGSTAAIAQRCKTAQR